ncbi:hypothetical protein KBY66_01690 [Synechococcus sp. Tobar12-5m-g]|uniref:hypothetical protein n=1 Tax=unclassified Synechococcus TaxID=2626047 RepID=UPI0020CC307E|nr:MULTISPECIES: hypothetical protein [unclassified Synechococcus]MCP9771349.1 hypothetical protein [Synechococcus sp. Tobar12-5m-g]MCP9872288.1 hypothetical protein [Synechococcus sp. Cruz CV-v-12]
MAPVLQPLFIGGLGLLFGLAALAWAYVLAKRIGKLRYRLANLERQASARGQEGLGLTQELSQLKAELAQLRFSQGSQSAAVLPAVSPTVPPNTFPAPLQAVPRPEPPIPAPAAAEPGIDSLIAAINRGDKVAIREASPAELNITRASEDAIQMGRSLPTGLEVVSGGGSYLHVQLGGEDWLLPTERTLEGFRTHQPAKGIFLFRPHAAASAQVVQAARLETEGDQWRVSELGEIHYPG